MNNISQPTHKLHDSQLSEAFEKPRADHMSLDSVTKFIIPTTSDLQKKRHSLQQNAGIKESA
jgi:hypothetical protein